MRNFKKFLALVLAMMMVLGGMVTVSAAEETAAADYTAAANTLAALGIVKGTSDDVIDFNADSDVKRYEMALLMARIMTGEVDDTYWSVATDNTTPFTDVTEYYGAIAYVADPSREIIKGDGNGHFMPYNNITYQDALTMAVRSLGYKQLTYPQGFINTAKTLGLTDGLAADLKNDEALNRGETFQIIYNTLFAAAKSGKSYAELNFGLTTETYVLVATNLQAMAEADRVTKDGYVALAKLNADGTYDYSKYIHVTEEELGLADGVNVEMKLGYSYTVKSFAKFPGEYDITENDTKKLVSYGDDESVKIAKGSALNNVTASKYVKIDGVNYELVTSFTNLYNKSTSKGNNDAELIVHSMYSASKLNSAFQHYIYDGLGNIMNAEGTEVALYNLNGVYYKMLSAGATMAESTFRIATEDDFAACAVTLAAYNESEMFGIVTSNTELLNNGVFYEITMIDDNNDGTYDRAIYIPYSVGEYKTDTTKGYRWYVANSARSSGKTDATPTINGVALDIWATDTTGTYQHIYNGNTTAAYNAFVREADITFVGDKPDSGEYIVYYYNPYARMLVVIENLGKPVEGTVSTFNTGSYAYDSVNGYYWYNGAQVTIDGKRYFIGYRNADSNSQIVDTTVSEYDFEYINSDIARYGFTKTIANALTDTANTKFTYLVLAGRVIDVATSKFNDGNDWMAFDYGWSEKITKNGYTSYNYEGDIVGVDENTGFIQVMAYLPADGVKTMVDIETINGYNYGLLVADYAALQYNYSGIGILQTNAYETMKQIVIKDFFKTLTADLNGDNYNYVDESKNQRQLMYIVTDKDAETGAYAIYTDLAEYWATYNVYRQPAKVTTSATSITFQYGISTAAINNANGVGTSKNDLLVQNEKTVVLAIAADGIYAHTGIMHAETINLAGCSVYKLTNDYIVVFSKTKTVKEIMPNTDFIGNDGIGYTYYMVTGNSLESASFGEQTGRNTQVSVRWENGKQVFYYSYLYNINEAKLVEDAIRIEGGLEMFNAIDVINTWGENAVKPIGAIYAEKNGKWTLLNGDKILTNEAPSQVSQTGTVHYMDGAALLLQDLLYNANGYVEINGTKYGCVYSASDAIKGAAATANQLNLKSGVKYDNIAFNAQVVNFYYDTNYELECIWVQGVTASTAANYGKGWFIAFDYVPHVSFTGTVLRNGKANNTAPLLAADVIAKGEQDAANAATLTEKQNAAKAAMAAVVANVDTTLPCSCGTAHTLADHLAAYNADIEKATLTSDPSGYFTNIQVHVDWFTDLVEKAVANAPATITGFVKNADGSYTITGTKLDTLTSIAIYKDGTTDAVATIDSSLTSINGTAVTVTTTATAITITGATNNATGKPVAVFAAGTYGLVADSVTLYNQVIG